MSNGKLVRFNKNCETVKRKIDSNMCLEDDKLDLRLDS